MKLRTQYCCTQAYDSKASKSQLEVGTDFFFIELAYYWKACIENRYILFSNPHNWSFWCDHIHHFFTRSTRNIRTTGIFGRIINRKPFDISVRWCALALCMACSSLFEIKISLTNNRKIISICHWFLELWIVKLSAMKLPLK